MAKLRLETLAKHRRQRFRRPGKAPHCSQRSNHRLSSQSAKAALSEPGETDPVAGSRQRSGAIGRSRKGGICQGRFRPSDVESHGRERRLSGAVFPDICRWQAGQGLRGYHLQFYVALKHSKLLAVAFRAKEVRNLLRLRTSPAVRLRVGFRIADCHSRCRDFTLNPESAILSPHRSVLNRQSCCLWSATRCRGRLPYSIFVNFIPVDTIAAALEMISRAAGRQARRGC